MGDGTARGGHLFCTQENRWVRFPYCLLRDIKCVIILAVGYLVASLKPPINRGIRQFGRRLRLEMAIILLNDAGVMELAYVLR